MSDSVDDKRSNLSKAFDPSILLEAFAIDQALTLLIDWQRFEYINRADSDDYKPEESQFINIGFGGLNHDCLRNTDLWEQFPYKYNLLVSVPAGMASIDKVDCLLSVVEIDIEIKEAGIKVIQYSLDLQRFRALYDFIKNDQPGDVLKILKVSGYIERFIDALN